MWPKNQIARNLFVWLPLYLLWFIHKDIWYATKVLGWTCDTDFYTGHHFHVPSRNWHLVRPGDYNSRARQQEKPRSRRIMTEEEFNELVDAAIKKPLP